MSPSRTPIEEAKVDMVWDKSSLYKRVWGMGERILWTEGLHLSFGGVTALDDVSIVVRRGELVGLIGPNGAGKTSLLNVISGIYRPEKGRVYFKGRDITGMPPHERAKLGIARTFQHGEMFHGMTVLEAIMLRLHPWHRGSMLEVALWGFRAKRWEVEARERAEHIIDLLELQEYRHRPVGSLPPGIQKKVDLAAALVQDPEVILMDEPMAGLSREEKEDIIRAIIEVRETRGTTMVLVEHDLEVVSDICDRVIVMDRGRVIFDGHPEDAVRDEAVITAYIGG